MNSTIYFLTFSITFQSLRCQKASETIENKNDEDNNKFNFEPPESNDSDDYDNHKQIREDYFPVGDFGNDDNVDGRASYEMKKLHDDQFNVDDMAKEREPGDDADQLGTNQHYNIPVNYQDFGRRFVLTYPYVEKNILNDIAEAELDKTIKQYLKAKKISDKELTPVKAPPKFVLGIAKLSALLEASKPKNPSNDAIQKDILRTGEYWDDVWKEDVDVKKMLRYGNTRNKLGSVTVKITPGSKLYELLSMLKERSPRFLYVINKSTDRYFIVLL